MKENVYHEVKICSLDPYYLSVYTFCVFLPLKKIN